MQYTISYLKDKGIVIVDHTGTLKYKDFMKQSFQALELGRTKKASLFLLDYRNLILQLTISEIFGIPELYEKIGASRAIKIAILMPDGETNIEDFKFYETVCQNRSWQVRVFTHKDAEMEWLQK